MAATKHCPLCKTTQHTAIYHADDIPIFQNKVYPDATLAKKVATSQVSLVSCNSCGFVYNGAFGQVEINYDSHYENEQAHSAHFQAHLASIIELFQSKSLQHKKIIEVGCGKGYFLENLVQAGFNVTGFDPAYEGDNPHIVKDYFSNQYANLSADIIVLRHVLEHIQYPLDFLHIIGEAVNYQAKIYIEVPILDWIIEQKAFWDIFYEHCNYFTLESLGSMFNQAEQGLLFNGQYMYLIADLNDLRKKVPASSNTKLISEFLAFQKLIQHYHQKISQTPGIALWGAGAKGVTFANLIDPEASLISCLIDINPKKQHNYIAKTAHKIISPAMISEFLLNEIIVMNDNYFDEIQHMVAATNIKVSTLNDF